MKTTRIEKLGCRVQLRTQDPNNPTATPYVLEAAHGRRYALVRNLAKPDLMFPVNASTDNVVRVGGYTWFTDADGELRPIG